MTDQANNPEITILHENKWISLRTIKGKNYEYTFSHEVRCGGRIVAILPYVICGDGTIEYLIRKEITPCWGPGHHISSITGGVENNNPLATAVHELEEESGFIVEPEELFHVGTCKGTKSTDTEYDLYAIRIHRGTIRVSAKGDGTELEKQAYCTWVSEKELINAADPLLYVMHFRIQKMILEK